MKTIFQKPPNKWTVIFTGLTWAIVYFLVRRLLNNDQLTQGWSIILALVPIIPFAFFLAFMLANLRQMDELHRRVQLEALAIAFPLAMLLFMLLGLLELVIQLPPQDWSYRHTWYYLPLFYFIGLGVAWRRYQ